MKKFLIFPTVIFLVSILFVSVLTETVSAKTYTLEEMNVDIKINEDSTMNVTEEITYNFTGEFREVFRQITLVDTENLEKCNENPNLQCGGFDFLVVEDVLDGNGYTVGSFKEFETEVGYENRVEVAWEFAPSGREFNGEDFTWTVKYKIYGGLGFFDNYDLFYWNALPPDRDSSINESTVTISFPEDIPFENDDLNVLGGTYTYEYEYIDSTNSVVLSVDQLSPFEDFTVILKFPKGIVEESTVVNLDLDPSDQNIEVNGEKVVGTSEKLLGIPAGVNTFSFSKSGYISQEKKVELSPGEETTLEVRLEQSPITKLLTALVCLLNIVSCPVSLLIIGGVVLLWYKKGRDIGGKKTIVPWFKPPEDIPPTVMGSLKDEKVDMVDITSTIIDVAYKGFIKIKEIGKKKYEFIKLKEFDDLEKVQRKIMSEVFGVEEKVETEDLKNKFYLKLPGIKSAIYDDLVNRKYFDQRPDKVRGKYLGLGVTLFIAGIPLTLLLMTVVPLCGVAIVVAGITMIIVSFSMPRKTKKGVEIFEKVQGFRMYMYTAERFKVQNLTPETFEKYLSYAMVFGIEKEWAKKFKDIYKQPPSWYEGQTPYTTFNTIYLINSLSSMNSSVGRTLASSPSGSSGGFSGGGWSGGGGFSGGFSGGGGGGGGVGAR